MVCKRAGRARRAAQRYRDGGGHRPGYPKVSREESVAVGVLFDILLRRMRARGCMAEMTYLPRQAKSLDEFHGKKRYEVRGMAPEKLHPTVFDLADIHSREVLA